ncbi:putative receptor-like protein kinase At3g47110 [Impatiens glandulifera]|uniref:putative receptor-like protein kinase At3g47110 n=1 Tax=Impatiens glandulifera TaxID=253017 RepID=UPI001FB0D2FA|nr:putative receptor-like protein kinase At3g47110 [Impatiens glandulifera]
MRFWLVSQQLALLIIIITTNALNNNETDHAALLAMKSKILDPFGGEALSSWNESFHFCNWEGVMCSKRHKRVTLIDLSSLSLSGTLSPHVGNLTFLRQLLLINNTFHGEIPNEIGDLYMLEVLALERNSFQGRIPVSLSRCYNLKHLLIGFNNLVGTIPEEFSSLSMLKRIYIHVNVLTGGIPKSVGNITSLEVFSAGANHFGGTIPNNLGQLKNLVELGLGGNQISGMIPSSLYNLSNLNILSLPMNDLNGSLPPYFGNMFPHLEWLQLHYNNFTGQLPNSIGNLTKAMRLAFERNNFSGKLTVDFSKLVNLVRLTLHFNNFGSGDFDEMHFLESLTNCSDLGVLGTDNNQFRGVLPDFVGNLSSNMRFFTLGENQLQGRIPPTIGNLVNLSILDLESNHFTGPIPSTIGKLQKLQRFFLSGNQLSGAIPESIGNLSLVNELYLSYNNLEGTIPFSIGNCQRLISLLLEQNNLSGTIPKELFQVSSLSILLNLSHNRLSGSLPLEIGDLKSLVVLDISNNNDLSGEIPSSISSCTSLQFLFLQGNMLQGSIPKTMEFLRGLQILDLSRNNLSGQIPAFLEKLSLINLNLSFNDFNGELPSQGVFANSSAVSVYGNNRLCGGIPSLELPRCPTKKLNRNFFSSKRIFVIVASILGILILFSSLVFYLWKRNRRERQSTTLELLPKESFVQVSYDELFKATDGFSSSNLIGAGSFGFVYKGVLDQIGDVAIKVLNLVNRGATKSFMAECKVLKNMRHRNLIKIITCCSSIDFQGKEFKALVYELMLNGNLEKWLHPYQVTSRLELNLLHRLRVAIDVASALDYLHYQCETQVIHCDLKPSNILLDQQMVAHVGDFGLARLYNPDMGISHHSSSMGVIGTVGYAAPGKLVVNLTNPVYFVGLIYFPFNYNSDVYSYGILLLEMLTGKRPTDLMFAGGLNIRNFAGQILTGNAIEIVIDPTILKSDIVIDQRDGCLIALVKIGLACSEELPQNRMSMTDVVRELQLIKETMF